MDHDWRDLEIEDWEEDDSPREACFPMQPCSPRQLCSPKQCSPTHICYPHR
jgi:hypothetical protein